MSVAQTLEAAAAAVAALNDNKAQAKRWNEDIVWCEKRLARSRERVAKLDAERPALEAALEAALKAHAAPAPAPQPQPEPAPVAAEEPQSEPTPEPEHKGGKNRRG